MNNKFKIKEPGRKTPLFKDVNFDKITMQINLLRNQNQMLKRLISQMKLENQLLKENLFGTSES